MANSDIFARASTDESAFSRARHAHNEEELVVGAGLGDTGKGCEAFSLTDHRAHVHDDLIIVIIDQPK